ncbi:tRNA uridine-5-carboxymethylaminomethyl(34) synthesis enzyme MnmG [Acidithiobacillus sp.]|jgi:tRNA uridine 5-carboxymethylaminomethyl modification enzyme|uniref:tRNA uridine-5-carboxymethylaminomethyl(34) synthesis enzyme MnmG n=1 Tax=Acidithiobacillus sp. TaxID=1872118 RepID=UPI0025C48C9C|nr:tRNA uridine-5-carboxymethylaminomethyl(34) synthesis enzyme MnmG [Acidithiobacillus sp.]MCK9188077.1 tRNA uridine-5-carboxymethylaminomethyl(34) synthesis enzyme MnmG [Acidithiobacillus sp.]MCK9360037.1 tRNA uridine-5-carboxymethylaminomethyl(34) synthesis enzyme MnmG [Acidithiobacillus sp.]
MQNPFDVIVVGGGHAGTEAAAAAARLGVRTLLLTQNLDTIGQMSCNPAIGGIGKGHLVKEVDALGGIMALAIDQAGIQFRTLNASKGPAVRATRAQADRSLYKRAVRRLLEDLPALQLFQGMVGDLLMEGDHLAGVILETGLVLRAAQVVLTTGTFLGGRVHMGDQNYAAGRAGDPPSNALAQRLRAMAFPVARLKTGTPPRIDGRSIDYSVLEAQPGDTPPPAFSFMTSRIEVPQRPCHITHTNVRTHEIIAANLHQSAMYGGHIQSVGPRYCPSIEDKVVRFADKSAHQIFLEPEGLDTHEVYPNGISTSLPFTVQVELVHSMRGLENAVLLRPGYAIEYDYLDPRDLHPSLESQRLPGLFCAGQINGTTGYEEAAAQGLLAGVNAARRARELAAWTPGRHEAYLGVMVDDLVTRGLDEPYRMFTSRAEYRLQLREDNADLRLTPHGRALGLVDDARWTAFSVKQDSVQAERNRLEGLRIHPGSAIAERIAAKMAQPLSRDVTALDLLRRPDWGYASLLQVLDLAPCGDVQAREQLEIECKYAGYVARQHDEIIRAARWEGTHIPADMDYAAVRGLSTEVMQRLTRQRPQTIGLASRIPGVTPAAISLLLIHVKRRGLQQVD